MVSPDRLAVELGTTWTPTIGSTAQAGHLVLDHLMRGRAIIRMGPVEVGGSLEIGPIGLGTPANSSVQTSGYSDAAAVLLGVQARGVIAEGELFAFGALGEMDLAFLPYHDVASLQYDSDGTAFGGPLSDDDDVGVQLDAMLRVGPWFAVSPIEPLTFTVGAVLGLHPHFNTTYESVGTSTSDTRSQAAALTVFAGASAKAGPATFVGQFSVNAVGTPAWMATSRYSADFAVRFDLAEL